MQVAIDACGANPRKSGHCWHTSIAQTSAGTIVSNRCCWCGTCRQEALHLPEHGPHGPKDYDATAHSAMY